MGTVLSIEDNHDNMMLVKRAIESIGHKLIEAATGQDGLRIANEIHPDLILLDINLPDIDGYEIARELRRSQDPRLQAVPLVAVTANALKIDADKAILSGCNAYLAKPLDIRELWHQVDNFLAGD